MKQSGGMLRLTLAVGVAVILVVIQMIRLRPTKPASDGARPATATTSEITDCYRDPPVGIPASNNKSLTDVTQQIGLDFEHVVGPLGTYFMPESIGAGGALHDFDGDGLLDIFLINGGRSPEAVGEFPQGTKLGHRLFRQTEERMFVDATANSGLGEDTGYGFGCAAGDVDNDGDPDLYVTKYGPGRLYLNSGAAHFSDATETSGIHNPDWGTCAAFFDYNRDGWLDLMVINYTSDPKYDHSIGCGFRKGLVSYCGPSRFSPTVDRLFRNDGLQKDSNGQDAVHFTDVTESSGLNAATTYGFGLVCADFNDDLWPDVFVANDGAPNRLWINQRDGTFHEEALERGAAFNGRGAAEAGMGIAVGDVNRDGRMDLLVTHLTTETSTLYFTQPQGLFEDVTVKTGLDGPTSTHTSWGAAFLDLNHDGWLDLPIVSGLVVPCHSKFPPHGEDEFQKRTDVVSNSAEFWLDYADRNLLMLGTAQAGFRDASREGGDFCRAIGSARSLIYGDTDNDGDLDLLVTNCGQRARLYRNDFEKSGNWLTVRVVDPKLRRDAHGAMIHVRIGEVWLHSQASPTSSYLSSNDVRVHFGLGRAQQYDEIIVEWPDGPVADAKEVFPEGAVSRHVTLNRGSGRSPKGRE